MSLNATPGSADANSYVTTTEANTYFSDRAHASAWEDFDEPDQLLIIASRQLDWYVDWKGVVASNTQGMDWPRTGVYDETDVEYDSDVIPTKVKIAVYELALSSIKGDRMEDDSLAGLSEVQAGSLRIKADNSVHATTPDAIPKKIWKIISGLYIRSASVVRLIRA